MTKWLIAAALLLVSPAMAADMRPGSPATWLPQPGENDTFHGVWVVNSTTGQVYRCNQVGGSAVCIEAKMMSIDEWNRLAQQNQQRR
jgi:hypothetical protein